MGVDFSDELDFHDHFKHFDDVDFFEKHHDKAVAWFGTMELIITITSVIGIIIVLILLCKCCQRNKYRGQVISPPPPPGTVNAAAPYPQQQYITTAIPVVQTGYPAAPYPAAAPYPHPAVAAPAPAPVPMPMPVAAAPYPGGYPHPQPQPAAPSAPDAHALPPSYEQATSADFKHSTPYNPGFN